VSNKSEKPWVIKVLQLLRNIWIHLMMKRRNLWQKSCRSFLCDKLEESAGVNVKRIEEKQKEKAEVRKDRMLQKIRELECKIKGLKVEKDFQESTE